MTYLVCYILFSENDSDNKEEVSLNIMIKQSWMKRKLLLEYDCAVTRWALSILPEIRDDVRLNLDGYLRMTIESVIAKLHVSLNPNSKVANNEIDIIIDIFWKDFGHFKN